MTFFVRDANQSLPERRKLQAFAEQRRKAKGRLNSPDNAAFRLKDIKGGGLPRYLTGPFDRPAPVLLRNIMFSGQGNIL